ncbi:MAG: hypothetical protein FWC53_02690 [Firmicutes bacterium]|nr:hypothetical protein [Bacillota bacterium]
MPIFNPVIKLKSTDGSISMDAFVTSTGTNTYYFDKFIDGIDTSKQYFLEVSSGNPRNTSPNKSMNVSFADKTIGKYNGYNVFLENSQIKFGADIYTGYINTQLLSIKSIKNASNLSYITGSIIVVEWVNGKSTVPAALPKMRFKSTDNSVNIDVFVTPTGTNTYYFDRCIEGIDTSKQYYFEISSGDPRNTLSNQPTIVNLSNQTLGNYYNYALYLENNQIKFGLDTYTGYINTQILSMKSIKNASNLSYITGGVIVVEWVNGKSTVPAALPKMRFKSTDNSVNIDVFVTPTGTNTYYFDRCIEGIDTSKQYYFEVYSGDSRNTLANQPMTVSFQNQTLGLYYNYALFLENNLIKFGK